MLYCALHEDPREDIQDHLADSVDRVHDFVGNFLDLKDNSEVAQSSLDQIDTHCRTVVGNVGEGTVLSCAENEAHRIADPKDVEVVSAFVKDVRNHCIHHVGRNTQDLDRVEDSHQGPVDCSRVLCLRMQRRYFQHPPAKHEQAELDCSIVLQYASAAVVVFSSHEVERPRLDGLRKKDNIRFQLVVDVIF